jgi:hypothetical protein
MKFKLSGEYDLRYYPPGSRKVAWAVTLKNGPTYEGVNYVLNSGFRGATQSSLWYIGLIDASGYTAPSASDTHALHPWAEFTAIYLSQRGLWSPAAAAGGQVAYSGVTAISITGDGSIRGAFLANQQATGTASGSILYSTAPASSGLAVTAGGTILAGYKLRLRAA